VTQRGLADASDGDGGPALSSAPPPRRERGQPSACAGSVSPASPPPALASPRQRRRTASAAACQRRALLPTPRPPLLPCPGVLLRAGSATPAATTGAPRRGYSGAELREQRRRLQWRTSTAASASSPSQGRCWPAPPRTCGGAGACYRRLSIPPDTKELGTDDIFPGGIPSPAAGCISWKAQRDMDEGVFAVPQCGWSNEETSLPPEETSLHSKTL
jgi:hypothetical protein